MGQTNIFSRLTLHVISIVCVANQWETTGSKWLWVGQSYTQPADHLQAWASGPGEAER